MNQMTTGTRSKLISKGQDLAKEEPNFSRFFLYTINATDAEDLAPYKVDEIETILRRSYDLLEARGKAPHFVAISPPADRLNAPEIIDVFSTDMPFIVDSVLAAIRAKGATIRLMTHPILPWDPAAHRVLEAPREGGQLESFLHIHVDPLPDDAARAAIKAEIESVLTDVARTVAGWRPMLERLRQAVASLRQAPSSIPPATLNEAMQFLGWLADHNFTFLGMREYALTGAGEKALLTAVPGSGLGILEKDDFRFLRQGPTYVEMTPQHAAFLADPTPLMVTKANVRATVHRRSHLDYIGVKLFAEGGEVTGELRILGLFTSMSMATPHSEVPVIRRKVAGVMTRSGLAPNGHAGKALMNALDTYPREELFQIGEDQLYEFATIIADLADRPRVRVLPRIDRFDNFVSVLVYVPRDRYTSDSRERIGEFLAAQYDARVSAYFPHFPEGELVRVHFILGRNGGATPRPARTLLEAEITELTRSFGDRLIAAAAHPSHVAAYAEAFSAAYQARNSANDALADIDVLEHMPADGIAIRFGRREGHDGALGMKFFHRDSPIELSDRVPLLENFGFRVIDERTFTIRPTTGGEIYIHDMVLSFADAEGLDLGAAAGRLEAAVVAVTQNRAENDLFNQLTLKAGLAWDDVVVLRALARYLKQVGLAYSQRYLAQVLAAHADAAVALVDLFHAEHNPGFEGDRGAASAKAEAVIDAALERTTSLDEDRILRRFRNLIAASLRTNFYQRGLDGDRRPALAIKFDCAQIDNLPAPRPYREIFVYSPRVEGLHLRFGAIARGGLRWSDRPEDFRTEVLGLVKAQQVKNSIIVPVGAKGAFVPKQTPAGADRDTVLREGTACYKIFVSTLLDVTDNLDGDRVLPPAQVVRRDSDDPYLVVAADKGTASFSDTANALALERNFWLGDAFASGGSVGYDHKKMAITARGGWEAVKRHFREMNRDIQSEPFSVVGVGDMSGDVFGNGMLLSPATRLIAAFDHRDIFIDPNPDATVALAERARLFALPRSSWQDYDKKALSKGGGIYSRGLKTVDLSTEARKALGLTNGPVTPAEVMNAILKAPVDLLWFGGIGTYVRAETETDLEAGDRANDAIRVSGKQVRAKVIGEGANLGMTQRGRIEYALNGGRINTDAIDNSAGVNSSDLEVNIKIALGALVRAGKLSTAQRNEFLAKMTDEVAELCLRNNYLQTLALSVTERRGLAEFPDHRALIENLEARGLLNRKVEFLPDDAGLDARAASGRGLTRPELAVLLAYAKNTLYADLLTSNVPDDPYLSKELYRYFPEKLIEAYPETITGHRLKREVIATVLSNAMINRGGPAFVTEMMRATSADAGQVTAAYAAARDTYGLPELNRLIDLLDGKVDGATQLALYAEVEALLIKETLWFLRNGEFEGGVAPLVSRYEKGVAEVRALLPSLLPKPLAAAIAARATQFETGKVSKEMARRIAELSALSLATDVVLVAERSGAPMADAARAFFGVLDLFELGRIVEAGSAILLSDKFDRMALDRALANLTRAQRDLAADILAAGAGPIPDRFTAWRAARPDAVSRVIKAVSDLTEGELTVSRLSVAAGLLSDLARSI